MRLNTASAKPKRYTHEGAKAPNTSVSEDLRRAVLSCLLWEDNFYESGVAIADRILSLAEETKTEELKRLTLEARGRFNLRHVPLLLLQELIMRGGSGVADTIAATIQRPDEITELLAMYWKDGRKPISKQLKLGLAEAFLKFDEYQLAKYDRDGPIRLRDVLFLTHAKPETEEQADLFKRLVEGELKTPDTWETGLSAGGNKRETFERLLREEKLGYMALLRNLRGMSEAGVDADLIGNAIRARKGARRVLPFRYISAAQHAPQFVPELDHAMQEAVGHLPVLDGTTHILIDTSGSMQAQLSSKSQMTRVDAAAGVAAMINGRTRVGMFATNYAELPAFQGLALVEAVKSRIGAVGHGTDIGLAIRSHKHHVRKGDRMIVITDGQSFTPVGAAPVDRAYFINVAGYQNSVGYHNGWKTISGFSEATIRYITEMEREG